MKILMVCLGNICRSPLAEGILQKLSDERNLGWQVDSAGTGSWHIGQSPDSRSEEIARKYGLDISQQHARQFHYPDFEAFDVIYAMDTNNFDDILKQAATEEERSKVRLILDELHQGGNLSVPDPYWDDDGFDKVYRMLEKACTKIVENHT